MAKGANIKTSHFISFAVLGTIFLLSGCGPSDAWSGDNNQNNGGVERPSDIHIKQAIDNGDVANYDANDPLQDQYLAVVNYLRGLGVRCNDPKGLSGPVDVDMVWEDTVAAAAKEHSEDMKKSNWYDHNGSGTVNDVTGQSFDPPRKSAFYERIKRNGYGGSMQAENIAKAEATYELPSDYWLTVMEGWMTSEHGHCSNIMNPNLTDFGMHESRAAVAKGVYKTYWTQDFGGY